MESEEAAAAPASRPDPEEPAEKARHRADAAADLRERIERDAERHGAAQFQN